MDNLLSTQVRESNTVNDTQKLKKSGGKPPYAIDEQILKIEKKLRFDSHLVCLTKTRSMAAESYYHLRHAIENLSQPNQGVVVAITSPGQGDGKTFTAINLAGALASNPLATVLLIDLDLRQAKSSICDFLNIKTEVGPGIVDFTLDNGLSNNQITKFIPELNLHLVTPGAKTDLPYEILKSSRLKQFIANARQHYDFVVLDTTYVNKLPDTLLISEFVDRFIIVVRADSTPKKFLEETLNSMDQEKVLGVVFNGSEPNA